MIKQSHIPRSGLQASRWLALSAFGLCAATAQAESPWNSLARLIAPPQAAEAQAQAAALEQTMQGAPTNQAVPEVRDEFGSVPEAGPQDRRLVASLNPGASRNPAVRTYSNFTEDKDAPSLNLGSESQDTEALHATDLFNSPEMLRLLGDEARFRYDPAGRPDPMLVPWVRSKAIFTELTANAQKMMEQNRLDEAVSLYQRILELNDTRYTAIAMEKIEEIAQMQNEMARAAMQAANPQVIEENIELPSWVAENTTGVIVSPTERLCLVGEHMLMIGDAVPDFPDVVVGSIDNDLVTYQIRQKNFEVVLEN